ncbi:MAG: glutamate-1-semialdehyde 2,1-aminomutase, partial [Candidatus Omnitrophica bacterium]|nr:glutamate-1-semialdehyde 2,1-aminomutase [Candidatus Omnitrophota bacterium]
ARRGTSFGAATLPEVDLAEAIRKRFPACERLRFTSSGTEAVMSAIRLARGFTGRDMIIKFTGGYHGHADALLVRAGSGVLTLGVPGSAGVTSSAVKDTVTLPYNDETALRKTLEQAGSKIACVIIEPVAANMGLIPARPSFLKLARRLTRERGALLIFDEVVTGFRFPEGGAQQHFGVRPDLTTLGKVIGGGLPVGAFGGTKAIMRHLAPDGPVYQAGTLSGNPLSMAAGLTVLSRLTHARLQQLSDTTKVFADGLQSALRLHNPDCAVVSAGSMLGIYFQPKAPTNFDEITPGHIKRYRSFFRHMLRHGVYVPPSAYETLFMSLSHTARDLRRVLGAAKRFNG